MASFFYQNRSMERSFRGFDKKTDIAIQEFSYYSQNTQIALPFEDFHQKSRIAHENLKNTKTCK